MLTETGRVVGIDGEGLWVETVRRSTCGSCAAQKGCGHGLLERLSDGKRGYIRVLPGDTDTAGCEVGDQVLFSIPEEIILRGSFIAYVLPLLGMLAGAIAAVSWWPGGHDGVAVLGAVGGLATGFAVVRWHGARHRQDPDFQPVLLRVNPPLAEPVTLL